MGLGGLIDAGAQNALTGLQQKFDTTGGQMQYAAANTEAAAQRSQATEVWQQTQYEATQAAIQEKQVFGQQKEGYASAGVETTGTPLQILNQTRMQGQMQINMIEQAGANQASLYRTEADLTQQTGLSDLLSSEAEAQIAGEQNQISQFQQKAQLFESLFGIGTQFAGGLLSK